LDDHIQIRVVLNHIVHVIFHGEVLFYMRNLLLLMHHPVLHIQQHVPVKLVYVMIVHLDDLIQILVVQLPIHMHGILAHGVHVHHLVGPEARIDQCGVREMMVQL
jgi:hypothetical protein